MLDGWSRSFCFIRKNTNGLSKRKENNNFLLKGESLCLCSLQVVQVKCLYGLNVYKHFSDASLM